MAATISVAGFGGMFRRLTHCRRMDEAGNLVKVKARSDTALFAALRQNDQSALGLLYDRYAPLVFTLVHSELPEHAEQITEDVFYDLWCRRTADASAVSAIDNLIRATTRRVLASEDSPLGRAEQSLEVLLPFAALPSPEREMLIATCIGQLDVHTVADAFDVPLTAVQKTVAAGLYRLRGTQGNTAAPAV